MRKLKFKLHRKLLETIYITLFNIIIRIQNTETTFGVTVYSLKKTSLKKSECSCKNCYRSN